MKTESEVKKGTPSAFTRFKHASSAERVVFGAYAAVAIVFFGVAIMSAFGVVAALITEGYTLTNWVGEVSTYLALNIIIGYGFFFCYRWLIPLIVANLVQLSWAPLLEFINGSPQSVPVVGIVLSVTLLLFLLATKKVLVGRFFSLPSVVAIVLIASLTF